MSNKTQAHIPVVVTARIQLHLAQAQLKLSQVMDELDAVPVVASRSRALRVKREQLKAESEAWLYLLETIRSGHYEAYREVNGG